MQPRPTPRGPRPGTATRTSTPSRWAGKVGSRAQCDRCAWPRLENPRRGGGKAPWDAGSRASASELSSVPISPPSATLPPSAERGVRRRSPGGVEYNVSYAYHAMFAYFDRENVALKGLAKFFKESSDEEREYAEKLMEYLLRGGKVKLHSILMPPSEFDDAEKGDALYAMELALSLEMLVNEKLLNLHAWRPNTMMFRWQITLSEFLGEQVEAIKKISEYVAQLRRVGKGHGVWHFDQKLLHGDAA